MTNISFETFMTDPKRYADAAISQGYTFNIANCKGEGLVLMSAEEYNGYIETQYILSNPRTRKEVLEGKNQRGKKLDWRKILNQGTK